MSANDAAALAVRLFRHDAQLCDQHPMKVARTTDNPSVSGNALHEATTSLGCSSHTQEIPRLSHDACVQTNPCAVFQVNPIHTADLSRSLSDTQITQTTSTCSQKNDDSSSLKLVESMAKEHEDPSVARVECVTQKQDDASAQVSKDEVVEETLKKTDDNAIPCGQNGTTYPTTNKDILDHLDVASLSMPDCDETKNLAIMEIMIEPLKRVSSCQNGNTIK